MAWIREESAPFMDGRYQVKTLRHAWLSAAAELWRAAYPEVYGSPHEFLLDPVQLEHLVALEESWQEHAAVRVYCMPVVVELATCRLIAASLLTKVEKNLQVEFSFVATHPDYRRRAFTDPLRADTRKIAHQSGAEYFTTFCETWHAITQQWCIDGGWRIAGIFPGNFTRWQGEGAEYRGCEVYFYRFVGEAEDYCTRADEWDLAPEVQEVWEVLARVNRRIELRRQHGKTS
jgi:hypothetical protein